MKKNYEELEITIIIFEEKNIQTLTTSDPYALNYPDIWDDLSEYM